MQDARGRLRLQSYEEHYACMGCHGSIGVTADSAFAFPRKLPGAEGWGYQDIAGVPDVPQLGHEDGEVLKYLRRVGGGDELRANDETIARFFRDGALDEDAVRRAGDLSALVTPSRARALLLDKAYMAMMREQRFELARDVVLAPPTNVHTRIEKYRDGTIRLDWSGTRFLRQSTSSSSSRY